MAMTRAQFGLLQEGLRKVFFLQYNEQSLVYPKIYEINSSKKQSETDHTVAGLSMIVPKNESQSIVYEDLVDGFEKTYTHTAYAKGVRISRELLDDELYGVMKKRQRALANATRYRKEWDHARLFNYANVTTYFTGGDGLALLSASHTLAAVPGTTWSNTAGSVDLSWTYIDTAIQAFRRLKDDQNQLINIEPKVLLIPPELFATATEILKSTGKPGTANNDTNAYSGRLQIVEWPHITDTDAWFILADKSQVAPQSFDRTPVEYESSGDFDTKDLKTSVYTRYSNGFTDPRFCYGSMGG